jgi:hypothetical protein
MSEATSRASRPIPLPHFISAAFNLRIEQKKAEADSVVAAGFLLKLSQNRP